MQRFEDFYFFVGVLVIKTISVFNISNTGKYITRIGSGYGYEDETPLAKARMCFSVNGFSLHPNTQFNTLGRDKLFNLIEYMARGAISNERVEIQGDGNIPVKLKSHWRDGRLRLTAKEKTPTTAAIKNECNTRCGQSIVKNQG